MIGIGGAAAAMTGCEPAAEILSSLLNLQEEGDFRPSTSEQIDPATHIINRITFGPRPGDYQRVTAMGIDMFIEQQLNPEKISDSSCDRKVASIESLAEPAAELYEYNSEELLTDMTRYKLLRGIYSKRQLYEVMVDFWTDHFNIVSGKGDCRWLKAADDRDVIRRHALGRFRDLVRASAVSPAMLIYLDGHDNKVIGTNDRPNENYARELLELHTLGVHGGYTQRDVMEVARCLSGWTYQNKPFRFRAVNVAFSSDRHDDGPKRVLGHDIAPGGGAGDLDRVLDIVCNHLSTARYVATKLCRRFIADPAPASAVTKVADAFTASGGAITQTMRVLLNTQEFGNSRGGLFKRPLRFVISALRATDARTKCAAPIMQYLQRMGHAPFQYPTPDGYPIEPAPWLGGLLWRWHLAVFLEANRLSDTKIDRKRLTNRLGGEDNLAAHLLGRLPSELERETLRESDTAMALMLAGPAFQWH